MKLKRRKLLVGTLSAGVATISGCSTLSQTNQTDSNSTQTTTEQTGPPDNQASPEAVAKHWGEAMENGRLDKADTVTHSQSPIKPVDEQYRNGLVLESVTQASPFQMARLTFEGRNENPSTSELQALSNQFEGQLDRTIDTDTVDQKTYVWMVYSNYRINGGGIPSFVVKDGNRWFFWA